MSQVTTTKAKTTKQFDICAITSKFVLDCFDSESQSQNNNNITSKYAWFFDTIRKECRLIEEKCTIKDNIYTFVSIDDCIAKCLPNSSENVNKGN